MRVQSLYRCYTLLIRERGKKSNVYKKKLKRTKAIQLFRVDEMLMNKKVPHFGEIIEGLSNGNEERIN